MNYLHWLTELLNLIHRNLLMKSITIYFWFNSSRNISPTNLRLRHLGQILPLRNRFLKTMFLKGWLIDSDDCVANILPGNSNWGLPLANANKIDRKTTKNDFRNILKTDSETNETYLEDFSRQTDLLLNRINRNKSTTFLLAYLKTWSRKKIILCGI